MGNCNKQKSLLSLHHYIKCVILIVLITVNSEGVVYLNKIWSGEQRTIESSSQICWLLKDLLYMFLLIS